MGWRQKELSLGTISANENKDFTYSFCNQATIKRIMVTSSEKIAYNFILFCRNGRIERNKIIEKNSYEEYRLLIDSEILYSDLDRLKQIYFSIINQSTVPASFDISLIYEEIGGEY